MSISLLVSVFNRFAVRVCMMNANAFFFYFDSAAAFLVAVAVAVAVHPACQE